MKKQFLSLGAIAAIALTFASCSNGGNDTATTDSTTTTTETTATTSLPTSTNSYAAMADSISTNSSKGYYLNPKTGKPYGRLMLDTATGNLTTESGEPVWRYVDTRTWGVYGDNNMNDDRTSWDQIGQAQMEDSKLRYKGDDDKWVDYDTRYMKDDESLTKKWKESDNGNKVKMVTEDGDKIKAKTDEEGNTKLKVNGDKIKVDSNGAVIKH